MKIGELFSEADMPCIGFTPSSSVGETAANEPRMDLTFRIPLAASLSAAIAVKELFIDWWKDLLSSSLSDSVGGYEVKPEIAGKDA